ncbi:MAG: sodium/glutamate symporter [Synechococcus sp.]
MLLDERQTVIAAILVLFLGKYLNRKIKFFQEYNIPEPVSGGIIASVLFWAAYSLFQVEVSFSLGLRDDLLIIFFTTIGLSSKLKTLLQGGRKLLILLVIAISYLILQNLVGIILAAGVGMPLPVGILAGSVALSGGHGTAIAWAPKFVSDFGIENALEVGIACATFGLVLGGMIGGPLAKLLIQRYRLQSQEPDAQLVVGTSYEKEDVKIDYNTMLISYLVICLAIGLGININDLMELTGLLLPDFVACLLAGIVLTNTIPYVFKRMPWPANTPSMSLISEVTLGLFLAMSLMSLQLWTLVDLAGPIAVMLFGQLITITVFTLFVVFKLMGKTYDAAVISAGYAGLALGATPTAIANMTAVTERFGPSSQAFIVVPLVGAFFIDIANAFIVQQGLGWLG